jgi:hypothetical protein
MLYVVDNQPIDPVKYLPGYDNYSEEILQKGEDIKQDDNVEPELKSDEIKGITTNNISFDNISSLKIGYTLYIFCNIFVQLCAQMKFAHLIMNA